MKLSKTRLCKPLEDLFIFLWPILTNSHHVNSTTILHMTRAFTHRPLFPARRETRVTGGAISLAIGAILELPTKPKNIHVSFRTAV